MQLSTAGSKSHGPKSQMSERYSVEDVARKPVLKFCFYITLGHLTETPFLLLENEDNISFLLYRVVVKSKKDRVNENVL